MEQDEMFLAGEGDRWYARNKAKLSEAGCADWPLRLLTMLEPGPDVRSVIELGCADGYRLAALSRLFGDGVRCAGIDASADAIRQGSERYPGLDLRQGLLSDVPLDEPADLVVVNFVLHWVDRARLVRSIAEIDRLVADGGLLLLGDFLPDFAQRRRYHHLPERRVYTYKQDYSAAFKTLGMYRECVSVSYDHDAPDHALTPTDSGSRACCALLRKSLTGYYAEVDG